MNDTLLYFVVITGALVLILGSAYLLDQRRKTKNKATSLVPVGPISSIILWVSYGILLVTILSIIGAFSFSEMAFVVIARNFLVLYIIIGIIYRIVKPRGI